MTPLAARIRRLRILQQMTQSQLAEKAGLSKYTVEKIEQSKHRGSMSLAVAVAVSKALGVTLDELTRDDPSTR